jgi:hypothetical protein
MTRITWPRRWRLSSRLAGGAVAVGALVAFAWLWAGPRLVEAWIARTLRDHALSGGRIRVRLGARELLAGRLREVVIEDATWDLSAGAPRGASPDSDGSTDGSTEGSADGPLPDLPVGSLEIRRLRLLLPAGGPVRELECDATLATGGGDEWSAALTVRTRGQVLEASTHVRRSGPAARGPLSVRLGLEGSALELAGDLRVERGAAGRAFTVELSGASREFAAGAGAHGIAARGASIALSAHVAPAGTGLAAGWSASIATTEAGWIELVGEAWPRGLKGMALSGTLVLSGELATSDLDRAASRVDLAASIRSGAGWGVESLAGTIRLLGLRPPVAPAGQSLRWRSIDAGGLTTADGSLSFHTTAAPALALEGASCSLRGGGAISVGAFELGASDRVTASVTLDRVSLDECVTLFSRDRIRAEGRLSGTQAVTVRLAPQLAVELGAGHLRAAGGGVLRFLDDPGMRELLELHVADRAAAGAGSTRAS